MNSKTPDGDRIAKVIARAGVARRREAERMIEAGRVSVNGKVIDRAALNVTEKDAVKCADLAAETRWYVPVDARLTEAGAARLERALAHFAVHPGATR